MLLTGCNATISSCPPLASYPREFQARAAAELRRLPKDSAIGGLVTDYGKFRDACRAIEKVH